MRHPGMGKGLNLRDQSWGNGLGPWLMILLQSFKLTCQHPGTMTGDRIFSTDIIGTILKSQNPI